MQQSFLIWTLLEVRAELKKKIVGFLVQMRTRKFVFEINWPLVLFIILHDCDHGHLVRTALSSRVNLWNWKLILAWKHDFQIQHNLVENIFLLHQKNHEALHLNLNWTQWKINFFHPMLIYISNTFLVKRNWKLNNF